MVCASIDGICNDNISLLTRIVSMHFDGLFDCSKGHFARQSLQAVVFILYLKGKRRYDVKGGGGRGSAVNVNLMLSDNKSIFRRPKNKNKKLYLYRYHIH